MKTQKSWLMLLALLMAGIGTSFAHGGGRVGIYIGPYWGPHFYPPPLYYPPRVVVVPVAPPPVYIEQQQEAPIEAAPAATSQYWHYCAASKGYYPYVKECPEGWQKVLPQPPR